MGCYSPSHFELKVTLNASFFKSAMSHNVEAMMWEPIDMKPIIQVWLFSLLMQKLNECMKVFEIAMI
jgi:hypothetical protein